MNHSLIETKLFISGKVTHHFQICFKVFSHFLSQIAKVIWFRSLKCGNLLFFPNQTLLIEYFFGWLDKLRNWNNNLNSDKLYYAYFQRHYFADFLIIQMAASCSWKPFKICKTNHFLSVIFYCPLVMIALIFGKQIATNNITIMCPTCPYVTAHCWSAWGSQKCNTIITTMNVQNITNVDMQLFYANIYL